MRRVKQAVRMPECKRRALTYLQSRRPGELTRAAQVAQVIWPAATFTAQGAGAAASRVLKSLEKDGLVRWISYNRDDWGWELRKSPFERPIKI
jgi:hypothetical protein